MEESLGTKSCCQGSKVKNDPEGKEQKKVDFTAIGISDAIGSESHEDEKMELKETEREVCPHECGDCSETQSDSDKAKMIKREKMKNCCCTCKPEKDSSLANWEAFDQLFRMRMKILIGLILYFCLWLLIHFLFFV